MENIRGMRALVTKYSAVLFEGMVLLKLFTETRINTQYGFIQGCGTNQVNTVFIYLFIDLLYVISLVYIARSLAALMSS